MDYLAGNDLAAYSVISGTPSEVTGKSDTAYTTNALFPNGGVIRSAQFLNPTTGANVSLADLWVHFDFFTGFFTGTCAEIIDAAGTSVARLFCTANGVYRIDYWNGAAWVLGGSTFNVGAGVRIPVDLHLVCGAAGSFTAYFNNNQQLQINGLNAAVDNGAFVQFTGGGGQQAYSQVLVSDTNTVGCKVANLTPNSNSAVNTAWANDYTNLVKTGYNDATLVSDATLNDAESYGATDVTLPTAQYYVSSVWFSIRARLNSAAPANVKPLMRIGGVNYNGAYNFANLDSVSFKPSIACFPTDPSTAAAWAGVTNLNAAEIGFITQT